MSDRPAHYRNPNPNAAASGTSHMLSVASYAHNGGQPPQGEESRTPSPGHKRMLGLVYAVPPQDDAYSAEVERPPMGSNSGSGQNFTATAIDSGVGTGTGTDPGTDTSNTRTHDSGRYGGYTRPSGNSHYGGSSAANAGALTARPWGETQGGNGGGTNPQGSDPGSYGGGGGYFNPSNSWHGGNEGRDEEPDEWYRRGEGYNDSGNGSRYGGGSSG